MIADRYGVVNEIERMKQEKTFHVPFGYDFISFNYRQAEDECRKKAKGVKGYIVEKISTDFNRVNAKEVVYRANAI